jgi:hypothetical protein
VNSDSLVAYLSSKLGYHLSSIMKFHLSFFIKKPFLSSNFWFVALEPGIPTPDLIGYANLPVESATSVVYGPANPKRRNSPRRDPGISLFFSFF